MSRFERIVVVGANGGFGRVLGRKLAPAARHLTGIDRGAAVDAFWDAFHEGSIEAPDRPMLDALAAADVTLLCVPEPTVLNALEVVLAAARADACVADIASVKSRIAAAVDTLDASAGYLSLHPMFAPSDDFTNRNLAVVALRENAMTAGLEALAKGWQARLVRLSAEQHDRLTAWVQAVPHALLVATGLAFEDSGLDRNAASAIATPVHTSLTALLARVVAAHYGTYWSIQSDNPYAGEARHRLGEALARVDAAADAGDEQSFAALVERLRLGFGEELDDFVARSDAIVASLADDRE